MILGYASSGNVQLMAPATGKVIQFDDFSHLVTFRQAGLCINAGDFALRFCDVTSPTSVHPAMCRIAGVLFTWHYFALTVS